MQSVILATGQEPIDRAIGTIPDIQVMMAVSSREQVPQAVSKVNADILIYAEVLPTTKNVDSVDLLVAVKKRFPNIRIIYLAGQMYPEKTRDVERIERLVSVGIYDVFTKSQLNMAILKEYIYQPNGVENLESFVQPVKQTKTLNDKTKSFEEVKPKFKEQHKKQEREEAPSHSSIQGASIGQYVTKEEAKHLAAEVMQQVSSDEENENILPTVYIVSSIKPGTVTRTY